MNSQENSTGTSGDATVTCPIPISAIDGIADVIERTDGLVGKSLAAKHLSSMMLAWLDNRFGPDAGKPGPFHDSRTIIIRESQWREIHWLAAEVWELCGRVDTMISELDEHATELCNATFDARKAVQS